MKILALDELRVHFVQHLGTVLALTKKATKESRRPTSRHINVAKSSGGSCEDTETFGSSSIGKNLLCCRQGGY